MSGQRKTTKLHILAVGRDLVANHGFSALGLSQLLKTAAVPKGSFYHYFESKEDFGCELLELYFKGYFEMMDDALMPANGSAYERLMRYWTLWYESQVSSDCDKRCLITKLGAEVSDLSEKMRMILDGGVQGIVDRINHLVQAGYGDGSIQRTEDSMEISIALYQMWIGATLISRISRDSKALSHALERTKRLLVPANQMHT